MKLLRPDQVANKLSISKRKVYYLCQDGELSALKIGTCIRIVDASVDRFLEKQMQKFSLDTGFSAHSKQQSA
ncbi:MAG: helix-turn-helix domain-containing protein [Desulfobacteraceae bacterium]|nr:helix-turn-helix domain-containing protein [Desulfobacteraceae bacterium]